jgi:hypothetical protein
MKYRIIIFLLILSAPVKSWGQDTPSDKTDKIDTLKINSFSIDLDLMFYLTHKEMNQYPDLKFVNTAQAHYLIHETELGLYFRQIVDRLDNGYLYYNHYLNLSSGIAKYKAMHHKSAVLRLLHPEPVFIFQNNSGRGLRSRFQTGLFLYPIRHFRPNFRFNLGLGCLYDWSSWEVNDQEKIDAAPPDVQAKILFINSHTNLRKDLYMDFSEWRPTLFLQLSYQAKENLTLKLMASYQQSLVSPFNQETKDAYPELKKVYPYIYSQLSLSAKVYKGFSIKSSFVVDYENNNLSIYDSSWESSIIFGVTWSFTGKKFLPVPYKVKK